MPGQLKVLSFAVHASHNEAARWGYWARVDRARCVGVWLAKLAAKEVARREALFLVFPPR